ncbi:hypothetical protein [Pelosinus sp. IPA-1]|uniref:hypothetical protein n=1 Tax=Pelosinus sp. IPA-1 TaxID=3029569 RepID=UPI002436161F|nr:hypothetical protein [Pelosinus sp. IPA-1]GMA98261.1 hypothetical protein PIPA1_10610 [Pelosinus sp. IPA-1]
MTKVAVAKVGSFDYNYGDVEKAINEVLELLGGIESFIKPGDKVLIKPNMLEPERQSKKNVRHAKKSEVTQKNRPRKFFYILK